VNLAMRTLETLDTLGNLDDLGLLSYCHRRTAR
jgi:DNA-directed RNA polymerase subunit N (RpoN/RPB10)